MSDTSSDDRKELLSNRLSRVATALGRVTSQVHKVESSLAVPEFGVLMILGSWRRPLTSSFIVETTAMDKTKVSRAVSSLDRRGWLERTRATKDRRFEYLELTPEGQDAFRMLMPKVEKAEQAVLMHLTDEERNGLEAGLSGLYRALGQ